MKLCNPETGYIHPRNADGTFIAGRTPWKAQALATLDFALGPAPGKWATRRSEEPPPFREGSGPR
jgi:putative alpha-1,2-mannosidase